MEKTEQYIAFDVGGSKLEAVMTGPEGQITGYFSGPGGNPLDIGLEAAEQKYAAALQTLMARAPGPVRAVYGGVAASEYYGDRLQNDLTRRFPEVERVRIEGDGVCLISGVLGHNDGASLICGTGSACYIRRGDRYWHVGGWGHLIDSGGGGYALARMAILAAVREHDGRGAHTLLSPLLEKYMGLPVWDNFDAIYRGGRMYVARFARVVFEARAAGDQIAARIFDKGAGDLAELVATGRRQAGGPLTVVFNGGIVRSYPEYAAAIRALCPADLQTVYAQVPPVYGGIVEAAWDGGLLCGEAFKNRFMEQYTALTAGAPQAQELR